ETPTNESSIPRKARASVTAGLKLTILSILSGRSSCVPRVSQNILRKPWLSPRICRVSTIPYLSSPSMRREILQLYFHWKSYPAIAKPRAFNRSHSCLKLCISQRSLLQCGQFSTAREWHSWHNAPQTNAIYRPPGKLPFAINRVDKPFRPFLLKTIKLTICHYHIPCNLPYIVHHSY